ncbi:MAG: LysR family transcriptional regulator [Alphaproteobacteria bacterium]|nr:LysR family transcriptional regulator [Alphaproteobacteria bacterium]
MELAWIDDFLALCQTRNFTRAAQTRNTTQSAYSRRIQRLEDWLGAPLFYRESRPVNLTPAGEEFMARAVRLREDIFDARRAVLSTSSHFKKTLRIYTTNTLASNFIAPWLIDRKMENYSLIVASIAGCLEAVKRSHADMAIVPHFGIRADLGNVQIEEIGQDRLSLVASTALKRAVTLNKNRLHGPVMAYTPGTTYGAKIAEMLGRHRIALQESPVCESASAEALLAQVEAGLGAAWIPEILLSGKKAKRCDMPKFFDIPYDVLLVKAAT